MKHVGISKSGRRWKFSHTAGWYLVLKYAEHPPSTLKYAEHPPSTFPGICAKEIIIDAQKDWSVRIIITVNNSENVAII